jgi:hypothetical protein
MAAEIVNCHISMPLNFAVSASLYMVITPLLWINRLFLSSYGTVSYNKYSRTAPISLFGNDSNTSKLHIMRKLRAD